MKTKGVFFDLGGTLLVMRRDRIFRQVLAEEGLEVSLERVHSAYVRVELWWLSVYGSRRMTPEQTTQAYTNLDAKVFSDLFPRGTLEEAKRISVRNRERWPQLEKDIPLELYPDSVPLLEKLSGDGFVMALVSNAPPDTGKAVDALGLPRYLKTVIISGVVGYSKPNPEIFRIALRQSGVRPDETIHIGDLYESDVVGARNAGIEGILIDREGNQAEVDCPRIESLAEVYGHIRR
jgi:HAD superfamily hydrolase (TIGR01549 family)